MYIDKEKLHELIVNTLIRDDMRDGVSYDDITNHIVSEISKLQPKESYPGAFPLIDVQEGITMLDYFAAKEKAAIVSTYVADGAFSLSVKISARKENKTHQQIMSEMAYCGAQEMIEERKKYIK